MLVLESIQQLALKYQELLVLVGFTMSAAVLRSAMQIIPSFEPITFFAVLSGFLYGKKKGFLVGSSSLFISNFIVFGGQGPWTVLQMFSFGIAGYVGGMFKGKLNYFNALTAMFFSTLAFEVIMNIYSGFFFGGNIIFAFFTAIPFMAIHFATNIGLALLLPKSNKVIDKVFRKFNKSLNEF